MKSAINITDLTVSYGQNDALTNATLEIMEGEFVCIIGQNGGGKTTLLKTLLGFLKAESGEIKIFGKDISKCSTPLSYVPQTTDIDRNFPISVLEAVMTSFLNKRIVPFKRYTKSEKAKSLEILKTVGLENHSKRQIGQLSGGEFQRLLIARALGLDSKIILLDEPTASVDSETSDKIFNILKEINKKGKTVVVVTHDISAAKKYADKIICINREVVFSKRAEEIE